MAKKPQQNEYAALEAGVRQRIDAIAERRTSLAMGVLPAAISDRSRHAMRREIFAALRLAMLEATGLYKP